MNMKNYRGSNKSSRLCQISDVKFCFKLCPVTRWHMSSEDKIQPSKWHTEPDRVWQARRCDVKQQAPNQTAILGLGGSVCLKYRGFAL